ncbi:hypothetical protein [Rossellomorea marisflavi]|uniref:hypothetical protein n=1 Tax=Rossellomorea marisflavi TaxID=189381 RepID=UPI003F9ECB92
MIEVRVKSGTNGHLDYDNNDLFVADIPTKSVPYVGDILEIPNAEEGKLETYLVREIKRSYVFPTKRRAFQEYITVYVISA